MNLEIKIKETLGQRSKKTIADSRLRRAAVLIPIFQKRNAYYILVTKRTEQVPHHKGQISFPGGSQESNEDLLATALREAYEEIGLQEKDVRILGELDDMCTLSSDFLISPFVGLIPYPYPFRINYQEIAQVIEIPLTALTNPQNWTQEKSDKNDLSDLSYYFRYQDFLIWGATARILRQLIDLICRGDKQ